MARRCSEHGWSPVATEPGAAVPVLRHDTLVLRPVAGDDDVAALRTILLDPSVARWWGMPRPGVDVALDWLRPDDDSTHWIIEVDGVVAGSIQASEESDPDYRHAGIDLFLGPEHQGRGLGRLAIRLVAGWLIDVRGHHRLTIDPSAANARAIAVYGALGFRPVGIMRSYERGPDGTFHDGLLMDLLAEDLR
jgi:aminoglycoside 6'-N-acetyltransferase